MEDKILKQIINEEQLLQEARIEAEKVYPDIIQRDSISDPYIRNELNNERYHLIHGYIACYIAHAKKRESEAVEFAEYCMRNIYDIDFSKTTEEIYELFKQQKQE